MRVLLVPEPLLGLPAHDVGETVARAWERGAREVGGVAHVHVLTAPTPARTEVVTVADPWGRPTPASIALHGASATVGALEAAGPALRRAGDDPAAASSRGVGELVLAALRLGAGTVVVPLDNLACHDGGRGLLEALAGGGPATPVADLLAAARERLAGVVLVGRFEDDVPLLGLGGASATQGEGKGMTPQGAQDAERRLGEHADAVRRALPTRTDLLTGAPWRPDREAGAGAGGGLGFAVLALGGSLQPRWPAVARDLGLDAAVADADLVVALTDRFDWRTLRSSLTAEAARAATVRAVPTVLLAGEAEAGRREAMTLGVDGLYPVVEDPRRRARVLADPAAAIAARTVRVARTWTPHP